VTLTDPEWIVDKVLKKLMLAQIVKCSPSCMESEGSILYSQEVDSIHFPKIDKSVPHP
jgi:hypothetical protein